MLRTAAAALVLAAPLAAAEAIDTSEFHGVRVVDDQSLIELGLNADVQLVRTGAANLSVVVDDLHIHGDVHTDGLFVDGVDIHDICDCDSAASPSGSPAPGDAADGPVAVSVEILTGTTQYSDTVASTFIEFYIPGLEWTPVYRFHRGGIAIGEKVTTDYVLPGEPTKLRLSVDGDTDYWGISQIDVTIAGGDELAILCTDVIGVNPAAGATGHWLSTDATTTLAQELVFDIEPVCKAFVSVSAVTGWNSGAPTAGTVYASFKVNGTWTDPAFFFKASAAGSEEVQHFGLLDEPTAIAFSVSTTDAWGFDSLTVIINGETHVLACEGTHPSLIDGGHDHFVDSNNAALPELLVLEIGHDECDLVNVTLNFRAGDTALSGAADPMHVRFKLPTTGNWTDYYTLYESISLGGTVETDFRLEEVPSQLEFFTDGSDKAGIGHVTFSADGSDPIPVVCNHLINRPPTDYSVNWLGGSANSVDLPDSMLVDLTRPACVEVHLDVDTGFVTFSDTDDTVLVEWLVNGSWTQASTFFTSSNIGEREEDDYGLLEEPEAVAFSTAGNDAWAHDYVAVTVHGETTVVVCEGVQTAVNPDPFNHYWIDANGAVAPTRTELNVTADDCDALQTVVLDLHAGDTSYAGTDDPLYVQFEDLAAAGGFGPQYWFFSSIGRDGELSRTFKLRGDVAPTKLNLVMTGTDNFGIGTLTATVNDGSDVVLVCADVLNDIPAASDNGYWMDGDNTAAIPDEKELSLLPGDAMCSHIATLLITTGGTSTSGTDDNLYVDFKVGGSFVGQELVFTSALANSVKSQTYGLQGEPTELKLTITGTNAYHFDAVQVILNGTQVDLLCAGSVEESASLSATTWVDGNADDAPSSQLFDFVDIDCDATTAAPVGTTVDPVVID